MAAQRAYLDYNASVPLLSSARAAMIAALDVAGNPSSVHAEGRHARQLVEGARRAVAALCAANPEHVVFTSGATEAASTLLTPDWRMGRAPLRFSHLYVCAADHPCFLSGGRFPAGQITRIPVDRDGVADVAGLARSLAAHDRDEGQPLVAIHLANNETGVIQPIRSIAAAVKAAGGVLVVDAVQAAGRIPLDIAELGADHLVLSAHKIGGPKGVGAIVSAGELMIPQPLVTGGGQERGLRAGTENLAGIAGFCAAAAEALDQLGKIGDVAAIRDHVEQIILSLATDAEIFGSRAERLANTTFFAIPGIKSETAQIGFDLAGVAVSAGSACSSGKVGPSHVLKAMGVVENTGALRVSLGAATTLAEIDAFAAALRGLLERRQERSRAA